MLQPSKFDVVVPHFNGQLVKGYPRHVVAQQTIDELRETKVSMLAAWSVRLQVPLDMACDCEKAFGWITNRLHEFRAQGFRVMEMSAEMREVKEERESKDEARWEPFWTAMVIHPERKDPRELIKDCLHYSQKPID